MNPTTSSLSNQADYIVRTALTAAKGGVGAGFELPSDEAQVRKLAAKETPSDLVQALGASMRAVDLMQRAHDIVAAREAEDTLVSMLAVPAGRESEVKFSHNGEFALIKLNSMSGHEFDIPMYFAVSFGDKGEINQVQTWPHSVFPIAGQLPVDSGHDGSPRGRLVNLTLEADQLPTLKNWLAEAAKEDIVKVSEHALELFTANDSVSVYGEGEELAFRLMKSSIENGRGLMKHYLVTFKKEGEDWQYSRGHVFDDISGSLFSRQDFWRPGGQLESQGRALEFSADQKQTLLTSLQTQYSQMFAAAVTK